MNLSIDLEEPCLDAGFGYENGDGYVRVCDKPRNLGGVLVMRHRWFWETYVGPIPEGYEINHLCKNRRCFNLKHLECLTKSEHKSKDNAQRYAHHFAEFKNFYPHNKEMHQKEMGQLFDRSQACISKWIIKFNQEETTCL